MSLVKDTKKYVQAKTGRADQAENKDFILKDKLSLIVDAIPSAMIYLDSEHHILFVNAVFEKLFELKASSLVGLTTLELFGKENFDLVKTYRNKAIRGEPSEGELDIQFRGKTMSIHVKYAPDKEPDGNVTGYLVLVNDVTERREAGKGLAHLASIINSSSDAILSKTLNSIITSWNEGAERIFGYTPDEMIGQSVTKLIPADRLNEEALIIERLKRGEIVDHFETKRITKDKKLIDVSLTISPVKDSQGNIVGASKIARDITAQKKLFEALKESEERLRMASEATNLGTWKYHPETRTLNWSDECNKILGFPGHIEPDIDVVEKQIHPDDLAYVQDELQKLMTMTETTSFHLLYRVYRHNDHALRWLKVEGKVYFNEEKNADLFIGTVLDVTEEKQMEQTIRENEERFRMTIEATQLGTWEYDPDTMTLLCSSESRKICGLPEDVDPTFEMIANHIYEEDKGLFYEEIKSAIDYRNNGRFDMQLRVRRYAGEDIRWLRAQGKVFFTEGQRPARLIGTMLDITDEKLRELELKSSVELFTSMAENVPAMIWMSGDDRYSDYFNKTWLEFTGRTMEEESGEQWLENVHPDDVQKCVDGYNKAYREQSGHYVEYRLRRHDGQYRWIADNSVPRFDRDGKFAGFISACIDIDDQKNFREKILESELKLKTIANASPVGLWMTDAEGHCIFVNETWIDWTGISFEHQLGKGWFDAILDEDRQEARDHFTHCLQTKEKYHIEFRIQRPDGSIHWCLTEGSPYFNIDGGFAGYAGSVTDITDIRKMEERKDDFIKMASHELKTPITSIKGYVQLLLNIYNEFNEDKFQSSKPIVRSSLQTISKQVSKLTRLVSELLDLTRIESGKLELHKTEFDLTGLVEETIQDLRYTTSSHALIVHNDFEGNICADKDRIAQVILNLLTNAIKYSPAADNVEVFVEGHKNTVKIRVKDHGIGIDKKDHEKIFQRFFRVEGKSEQTYPGFGIGLFIASEIIQRHGGLIHVISKKNEGAEFVVSLPVGLEKKSSH